VLFCVFVAKKSFCCEAKEKIQLTHKATKGTKNNFVLSLLFSQKNLRALCGFVAKKSFCCEAKEKMQLKI
jgi:hypothetical protein